MSRFNATANVILTFDGQEQEIYNADINVGLPIGYDDLERFEVDVVKDVLAASSREHEDLVKISLCYDTSDISSNPEATQALEHLCRKNAKYYFQPDQRDPHEDAIVNALGVAGKTKDFG